MSLNGWGRIDRGTRGNLSRGLANAVKAAPAKISQARQLAFCRAPGNQSAVRRLTDTIRAVMIPGGKQKAGWVVWGADADPVQWFPGAML